MFKIKLLIVSASAAMLSACVVSPYPQRVVYAQPVPSGQPVPVGQPVPMSQPVPVEDTVVVDVAPPAPYVEVVPAVPFVDAIWIGGYWGWYGGRHQWVPGRWEHPRPGYTWRAHAWVNQGGRWHLHGGGWVRR
jgi:hypothetical protein